MKRSHIVIGAGGHAKVLIDALLACGSKVLGVADEIKKEVVLGSKRIPYLGNDEQILKKYSPAKILLVNGIGSTGDTAKRRKIYEKFKRRGYSFARVLHPSAVLSSSVVLGEGAQVMAGAVIQPGTVIGANSIINTRASVDHDCSIGAHTHVAPGAVLCGGVHLGDGAHVGSGAVIIQNACVAAGVLVRARSLVKK